MKPELEPILFQRARALARPLVVVSNSAEDMLEFVLGDERFAASLVGIREVVTTSSVTSVPGVSPPFVGLTNVRGALIPVLDPRRQLGVLGPRPDGIHPVLVVDADGGAIGLWADRVEGLIRVEPDHVDRRQSGVLPGLEGRTAELTGVINLAELIKAARLMAAPENRGLEA